MDNGENIRKDEDKIVLENDDMEKIIDGNQFIGDGMNAFERKIIHTALQGDKIVITNSEGDEPFRHVVISYKK